MELLTRFSNLLSTHPGRDKVIRASYFLGSLLSALWPGKEISSCAAKLAFAAGRTRCFTRLLDNFPMLQWTLSYGIGEKSEPMVCRILQIIGNVAYQLYYPAEHVVLFSDLGIVSSINKGHWELVSLLLWAVGLFTSMNRAVLLLYKVHCDYENLYKHLEVEKMRPDSSDTIFNLRKTLQDMKRKRRSLFLLALRDLCDLINAFHWMPASCSSLSGKLTLTQSSTLGCISSAIFLYFLS